MISVDLDDILHILLRISYNNIFMYDRSRSLDRRPSDPTNLQMQKRSLCTIEQ